MFYMNIFLALGDASVSSDKMAAPGEKSLCVFEYHTSKSVVTVQISLSFSACHRDSVCLH